MPGTVKQSGDVMSTGTMATGIIAVSVAAWCLELNALEDALDEVL
jgi:hypothetical protein